MKAATGLYVHTTTKSKFEISPSTSASSGHRQVKPMVQAMGGPTYECGRVRSALLSDQCLGAPRGFMIRPRSHTAKHRSSYLIKHRQTCLQQMMRRHAL
jgi:hypothetical protein